MNANGYQQYKTQAVNTMTASEIVQYLKATLNRSYAISRELSVMYDFFMYELGRIEAGRNSKVIQELKELVEELREAFREASRMLNN